MKWILTRIMVCCPTVVLSLVNTLNYVLEDAVVLSFINTLNYVLEDVASLNYGVGRKYRYPFLALKL